MVIDIFATPTNNISFPFLPFLFFFFCLYKYTHTHKKKKNIAADQEEKMGFLKFTTLFISFTILLFHQNLAQNTPNDFLTPHNIVRATVNLRPLTWSMALVDYAQKYANQRAGDCNLQHSGGPYGENLAEASWDMTAGEAVKMWTDEKNFYNYESNSCDEGQMCGHYTQIVWRHTTAVGCARAQCRNNHWTFVICSYNPPGNFVGERPY